MVSTPQNLIHCRQISRHQTAKRSVSSNRTRIPASSEETDLYLQDIIRLVTFFIFAFNCNAGQRAVYVCPMRALFIPHQSHVNPNFSFPSSETRFWKHLKDVGHIQPQTALGMNFTHSFVSPLARPTVKKRDHLPADPELFFLRLALLRKSGRFL